MTGAQAAPRIDVVAAALVDDLDNPRQVLAARRTEPALLAGGWEFAGGKVDPGESPEEALHREIGEELGVSIALGQNVPGPLAGWWPLGERYRMRVWLATVRDGIPQPLEGHSELRWLACSAAWSVDWLPSNRPIVQALLDGVWNREEDNHANPSRATPQDDPQHQTQE